MTIDEMIEALTELRGELTHGGKTKVQVFTDLAPREALAVSNFGVRVDGTDYAIEDDTSEAMDARQAGDPHVVLFTDVTGW